MGRGSPLPQPRTLETSTQSPRKGKAPPVDTFTGERAEIRLEDWLPALDRAALWNGWTVEEMLLQLAGHLRGRALQEWNLLPPEERQDYDSAKKALRGRLDAGGRTMAAQDVLQREREPVADIIRRLERTFQITFGRDQLSTETRNTLLHGQLYTLMKAPAVSGAQSYPELCLTKKSVFVLEKRQQYHD